MCRKLFLLTAVLLSFLSRSTFADDDSDAPKVTVSYASGKTVIQELKIGGRYFNDRGNAMKIVNPEVAGLKFTCRPASAPSAVTVSISAGATVYVLVTSDHGPEAEDPGLPQLRKTLIDSGWKRIPGDCERDARRQLAIYRQTFPTADQINFSGFGHSGTVIVSENLQIAEGSPDAIPPCAAVHSASVTKSASLPTTRISNPQSTIKVLSVLSEDGKDVAGQSTDFILTVTSAKTPHPLTVRYIAPVGDQMAGVTDDVLRYIHLKYPTWYADKAELTFGDRGMYDGPSIGAAIGTLIRSVIEGFTIDPNAAITGDIAANGAIHPIGGLSYKLHGASAAGCTIVAVPMKNYDNLVDAMIYKGPSIVTGVQVIGISDLDDAVAVMRSDREANLTSAIALFAKVQQALKDDPHALAAPTVQSDLQQTLALAPNHLSAMLLLMLAEKKEPKTLSPTASLYYTNVAVSVMVPILKDRAKLDSKHTIPSSTIHQQLADLDKLRPIADQKIQPLIDAWAHFLRAWSALESGGGSPNAMDTLAQKLTDEIATVNADPDLNQKLLNEGM